MQKEAITYELSAMKQLHNTYKLGAITYELRNVFRKKTGLSGNFSHTRGGGLTQTHFFCLFAKFFLHAKIILRC